MGFPSTDGSRSTSLLLYGVLSSSFPTFHNICSLTLGIEYLWWKKHSFTRIEKAHSFGLAEFYQTFTRVLALEGSKKEQLLPKEWSPWSINSSLWEPLLAVSALSAAIRLHLCFGLMSLLNNPPDKSSVCWPFYGFMTYSSIMSI